MQFFPVELKKALCKIDQNNIYLIIFVILGYLAFSLYNKSKGTLSPEEKARKYRKSIKYFNKHQKENEEFFLGPEENIATS